MAFVGADALKYIGGEENANELELYCWDKPGSTSPAAIRELYREGAKIYFVDDLRMKVFWSQRGGFVLGSPNLSRAALDDSTKQNLLEIAAYFEDSTDLPLHNILKQLQHHGIRQVRSHADIDAFADRCNKLPKAARKTRQAKAKRLTFDAYMRNGGPKFSYVAWSEPEGLSKGEREAAAKARSEAFGVNEEPSDYFIDDAVVVTKGKHHRKWILTFRSIAPKRLAGLKWIYAHAETPDGKYLKTKIQVKGLASPEPEPFDVGTSAFKTRFRDYIRNRYRRDVLDAEGPFNQADFLGFESAS